MRALRVVLVFYAVFAVVVWMAGPVGIVVGAGTFLGGWAIGHRTGRADERHDQTVRMQRWIISEQVHRMEGDR